MTRTLSIIIILINREETLRMRQVGLKYLKHTQQFREIHHSLHQGKLKKIMTTQKSHTDFTKKFPQYPHQYAWHYSPNTHSQPLHAYIWNPTVSPKAILLNFNALNAHTGLSGSMAQSLSESGIVMAGFDYPNFGKSHSPHPGHIQSVEYLENISQEFLGHIMNKFPKVPVFFNGVSMGGLIAFNVGRRNQDLIKGCILLNPAFKDNPINNHYLKKLMMYSGMLFPKFQTIKPIHSNGTKYSLKNYKSQDTLMYSGKVWTSTTYALLSHMHRVSKREHFEEFALPFLCVQGGTDKVLDPFVVFQLERDSKTLDKEIVIIPDLWHSVWFDDHHDEIVDMVRDWILQRV